MRTIKFRAWHKVEKRMIKVYGLNRDFAFEDSYDSIDNTVHDIKNVKLMQYTGLKDKNGKEIYEGDIVNYVKESNLTSDKTYLYGGEVYYDNFTASYRMKECEYPLIFKGYEIIGNKFENPELLD